MVALQRPRGIPQFQCHQTFNNLEFKTGENYNGKFTRFQIKIYTLLDWVPFTLCDHFFQKCGRLLVITQ